MWGRRVFFTAMAMQLMPSEPRMIWPQGDSQEARKLSCVH